MLNGNDHQFWPSQTLATQWTRYHDKLLERALLMVPEGLPNRWELIAEIVPGMSPMTVKQQYEALIHDLFNIDSGRVDIPNYADDLPVEWPSESLSAPAPASHTSSMLKSCISDKRKGAPWTEEEHKLFLIGLNKYGKGDWRSISRHSVVTKTPSQVASHAQKYFLRLNSKKKERKRTSIHDVTIVESNLVPPPMDHNWFPSQGGEMQQLQPPQQVQHQQPQQMVQLQEQLLQQIQQQQPQQMQHQQPQQMLQQQQLNPLKYMADQMGRFVNPSYDFAN